MRIEAYVDDMIIKGKTIDMHLTNLTETFLTLEEIQHMSQPSQMCL